GAVDKEKSPPFGGLFVHPVRRVLGVPAARGRRPHLLEAGAAVDRLVAARLERDASLATAVAAGGGEELARAAHAAARIAAAHAAARGTTCRPARRAPARLVHETARGLQLLRDGRRRKAL